MTTKSQLALAVGAGYMLGRTKKMKLALMLAAGGATRQLSPGGSLGLLNEGRKLLAESPEVAKLGKTVRHELMNAAKTAAVTAASQRIDSLNSRLESGESLLGGHADTAGGKKSKRRRDEEPEDDEDYYEDAEVEEPDEGEESDEDTEDKPRARRRPTPRRRSSSSGTSRPRRSRSSTDDNGDDDDELARVRRTRAKASTDSTPVRRTRK
ncbi:hypothetical protein ACFTWF_22405 [Rhodococcus sp. NPDC056960]|uniref:hypothetical protein n=1 Tax=Rhodococcus sp. NPDC056960 TaxID=3345982 RepID=UPI003639B3CB